MAYNIVVETTNTGVATSFGSNDASIQAEQTFTTVDAGTLTNLHISLTKNGSPTGNFTFDVFATDVNHKPTGSSLGQGTIACSGVTTTKTFYDITMSVVLSATTQYCIVASQTTPDASNYGFENGNASYAGSEQLRFYDGGSWTLIANNAWAMTLTITTANNGNFLMLM